jgi:sensor histidine kinase YesM
VRIIEKHIDLVILLLFFFFIFKKSYSQQWLMGLNNLDARTKLMQGIMTIDSQPGKGTSVLVEIPYNFNGI